MFYTAIRLGPHFIPMRIPYYVALVSAFLALIYGPASLAQSGRAPTSHHIKDQEASGNSSILVRRAEVKLDRSRPQQDWNGFGGGPNGAQYSPVSQINRSNVKQLVQAWT